MSLTVKLDLLGQIFSCGICFGEFLLLFWAKFERTDVIRSVQPI